MSDSSEYVDDLAEEIIEKEKEKEESEEEYDISDTSDMPVPPAAKALVFIDFDNTMTINNMWELTDGTSDPTILNDVNFVKTIFGNEEYIARFREFWEELNSIPNLEVIIVSKSWKKMISRMLEALDLPKPTGGIADSDMLSAFKNRKDLYIKHYMEMKKIPNAIFIDNSFEERRAAKETFKEILKDIQVCCDDLINGLTPTHTREILEWAKKVLGKD
jgi:beta-phosphoglucomutase-like phosphatase (HAD superfamily)